MSDSTASTAPTAGEEQGEPRTCENGDEKSVISFVKLKTLSDGDPALVVLAVLASSSARSFPGTPTWALIQ